MKNLLAISIWAHDAIPADEWKYRNLKRVAFPFIDLLFLLGGLYAAYYGIQTISEFFQREIVDSVSTLLSVSAIFCLIGVSFPRLWALEITGRSILLGLMIGYFVALFRLTSSGEGTRGFGLTISGIVIVIILWRLSLLGSEWQTRRIERGANG